MRIPESIIAQLETELDGLNFGSANLSVIIHDGHARFEISRKVSIVPGKLTSGSGTGGDHDA